jgi:GTP-binding protein
VGRADVVVLMIDAQGGIAEQDQRLLGLAAERGRAIVVGLNKYDLLDAAARKAAEQAVRDALAFAKWAPIVGLSAKTGQGVGALMQAVWDASLAFRRRVPTGELNRFFEAVLERQPPPTHQGRAPRLYYVTQASVAPPVFVAMCSHPEYLKESYKRFVGNQLRQHFGFQSVPLVLRFRDKKKKRGD